MSFVTTQPEILMPAISTSNARLLAGGSPGYPRDGTGMGGSRPVQRASNGRPGDSSITILARLPAVVVSERLPAPALPKARDGIISSAIRRLSRWQVTGRTG